MADLIQVTPEELRERANDVRKCRDRSDESMTNIASLIRGLNEIWTGEAQMAFESKLNSLQNKFMMFSEGMVRYADAMDTAANELENTDRRLSSTINNFMV